MAQRYKGFKGNRGTELRNAWGKNRRRRSLKNKAKSEYEKCEIGVADLWNLATATNILRAQHG